MLLKSVTLNNFRQFQDAHIDFSQGIDGKNVTIIIGKNGSGKTSLAQAFFWCLYGDTSFADKTLLNRKVAEKLSPNESATVQVELKLRHGVFEYVLTRKQIYKKNTSNQIRSGSAIFDIAQKDQTGNTKFINKTDLEYEVKRILPRELAQYFFFDGERIEKMGQDISAGKKAEEFAEAVKRLLGLSGMLSAIEHLGGVPGTKRGNVIGKYEKDFDATGNQKIRDFTATIERCDSELTKLEDEIKNLNKEIESAENRKSERERKIGEHTASRNLQKQKDQLKKEIETAENQKSQKYKEICQCFNSPQTLNSLFSVYMIFKSLKFLQDQNMLTNDIPLINAQVIETLLNQKKCLCGTDLEENHNACETLKKLLESIPTQAISMEITKFKIEARMRTKNLTDVLGQIQKKRKEISLLEETIINNTDNIRKIDETLGGEDVSQLIRTLQKEVSECE